MSIVDELKRLIAARGGSATGIQTIAEALDALAKLAEAEKTASSTPGTE